MADTAMIALIQELMEGYDDSLDTSEGSAFYTKVITPLMRRIGGDPLSSDPEVLIAAHLKENVEGIDAGPRSGVRNLLAQPLAVALEPYVRELTGLKVAASLNNYESMTRAEVNALLGNFFITLQEGSKSQTTVRMYFLAAQTVVVTPLTEFSTGDGLNFYPTSTQTITSTSMSFNVEDGLYYFDVTVESENAGDSYNVDEGEINTVTGMAGVVKITNKSKAQDGTADETKLEGITRAQDSITVRNLAVLRGAKTVLQSEFLSIDDIEVVGMGDDLMLRDVLYGPISISGIPGGYVGADPALIGSGQAVHIGGKTDIWLFTQSPTEETIDITNLTNSGGRIFAGSHGFTVAGPSTTTWRDAYGLFVTRGIQVGDFFRWGEVEYEILGRTESSLTLATAVDGALNEQTYEIVRYGDSTEFYGGEEGRIYYLMMTNLIAEDEDGDAVTDDDGDVVIPVYGSTDNAAYTDGIGDYVKVTENIADANMRRPMVRVKTVEFLDPLDLSETGEFMPLRDVLLIKATEAFTGGDGSTRAAGSMRFYFKDAVNFFIDPDAARLADDDTGVVFVVGYPIDLSGYDVEIDCDGATTGTITITGLDTTAELTAGDRIKISGVWWTLATDGTYAAGDTTYDAREIIAASTTDSGTTTAKGILEADMQVDSASDLYYYDTDALALSVGAAGNVANGTTFSDVAGSGLYAEGYSVLSQDSELSYSMKELIALSYTRFVNDDKDLGSVSTAYAVRVTYDYAEDYDSIQDYVEDEDNRPVGEDLLIRHMLPSYVLMSLTTDMNAEDADEAIIDYLMAKDPTEDFELSDLVDEVYEAGAEYIQMPISASVLSCARDRSWSAELVTDTHTTTRINHYIADTSSITSSQSS